MEPAAPEIAVHFAVNTGVAPDAVKPLLGHFMDTRRVEQPAEISPKLPATQGIWLIQTLPGAVAQQSGTEIHVDRCVFARQPSHAVNSARELAGLPSHRPANLLDAVHPGLSL